MFFSAAAGFSGREVTTDLADSQPHFFALCCFRIIRPPTEIRRVKFRRLGLTSETLVRFGGRARGPGGGLTEARELSRSGWLALSRSGVPAWGLPALQPGC
jgi:hypothetical protein